MPKNPATEIAINNENAKAAFVAWWATMMAQGYQYGHEALCNVWVGFDDGRSALAQKVLETVTGERDYNQTAQDYARRNVTYERAIKDVTTALRDLFQRGGVELVAGE